MNHHFLCVKEVYSFPSTKISGSLPALLPHSHTRSLPHSHTRSLPHSHTRSLPHTLTPTLSHTLTLTHTHSHTPTYTVCVVVCDWFPGVIPPLSPSPQALYASKIVSYAQGFMLLREAAKTYNWKLNYGSIALMWRGGCIIRSRFLGNIKTAFDKKPELTCLLLDDFFKAAILDCQVILNAACTILYTYTVCVCVRVCVGCAHMCTYVCVCVRVCVCVHTHCCVYSCMCI